MYKKTQNKTQKKLVQKNDKTRANNLLKSYMNS